MHLFTYGTLMVPEIMSEVAGCTLQSIEVTLKEYRRFAVRNEQYPGVVQAEGGAVNGILYRDVPAEAVRRLDLFEGEMYSRETVQVVRHDDGASLEAMAYIVKPAYAHLLTGEGWDLQRFLEHGREQFENRYGGYAELKRG